MASHRIRLFLSYAWSDDQAFVVRLHDDLMALGYEPWMDLHNIRNRGRALTEEVIDAIDSCDRVIAILGKSALTSEACAAEREYADKVGKIVTSILRLGEYHSLPREIFGFFVPDFREGRPYDVAIDELQRVLRDAPAPLGPTFDLPALPPYVEHRPEEMRKLRAALTTKELKPIVLTSAKHVALEGMGGVGKTVLAALVARTTPFGAPFEMASSG